jgi:glucose-6-phosphate 1-dehydrogenase
MDTPFAEGENITIRPPSTAMVIFGASGDLTHRKLIPALYNLAHDGYLPSGFIVLGASRSPYNDETFRQALFEALRKHSRRPVSSEVWERFAKNIYYQRLDAHVTENFAALRSRLESLTQERSEHFNYLYYLATAPNFFGPIAANLKQAGMVEDRNAAIRATSLITEKPFGHDLASARELNRTIRQSFAESQIFRIDHYLGKETVQNILVFRFANGIFEPLWNHKYIDHIQISVCEEEGVGSRSAYFDSVGILRDIVQNHVLQMLSLLCIEPPISLSDADSIRDEKVKVLRSIKRFTPETVRSHVVRAQYRRGYINGQEVVAYVEEDGVPRNSTTETYAALKLEIDNWRWSGVPIYVRAGKRLPKRITEITVFFKRAPDSLFKSKQGMDLEQNVLAIRVQPDEGISLKISSKPPGPRLRVRPVVMDFNYGMSFGVASADAYERLLLDAMKGDATLFTRDDEIEQSWDLLDPVQECWSSLGAPHVYTYDAGSWGPKEAAELLRPMQHRWRRL